MACTVSILGKGVLPEKIEITVLLGTFDISDRASKVKLSSFLRFFHNSISIYTPFFSIRLFLIIKKMQKNVNFFLKNT
jgi:hypothetical protein